MRFLFRQHHEILTLPTVFTVFDVILASVDKLRYLLYNNNFSLTSLAINDKMFLQLNNKYKLKKGAFINAKTIILSQ